MKEINAVVNQLLKNGAVKEQVTVKSCSEYTKNQITRVKLVLNKPIRGITENPDTGEKFIGDTNTIFVSVSSIAAVFGENENTVGIKRWVKDNPSSLRVLLPNASIKVICEDVSGDIEYVNPFSDNAEPKNATGYDSVYHHIIDIALSPRGLEARTRIEDKILGI